jgi:hypothetical protein
MGVTPQRGVFRRDRRGGLTPLSAREERRQRERAARKQKARERTDQAKQPRRQR